MIVEERAAGTPPPPAPAPFAPAAAFLLFLLSGAAALIYEVVWTREITTVFGGTSAAISTVLAAFMAGLALGGYALGRWVDRGPRPWLRIYALLEAAIGAYALLVPVLIGLLDRFLPWFYRTAGPDPEVNLAVRFGAAFLLFLVPATLMGGTLPVLARALVRGDSELGARVGLLYGANTLGAAAGTFLAGYLLIPSMGLGGARATGVGLNLLAAAIAFVLSRRAGGERAAGGTPTAPDGAAPRPAEAPAARGGFAPSGSAPARASSGGGGIGSGIFVLAYALSGFAALSLEVVWTKVLSLVLGTSTYAFAAMLTVFLLGLALGSLLVAGRARTREGAARLLFLVFLGIASFSGLSLVLLGRLPLAYVRHFDLLGEGWVGHQTLFFLVSVVVLLPATTLLGATFALTTRIAVPGMDRLGSSLGRLYAMNTVGSVLGAVATGFLFIPLWGRHGAGLLAVLVYLAIGVLLALALRSRWGRGGRLLALGGLLVAALAALLAAMPWDPQVLASGPYVYFRQYRELGGDLRDHLALARILSLREEPEAVTTVVTSGDHRYLRINGKADASDDRDMETQRLIAYAPLAYRPDAQDVLVIGLGSGVTAGSVLRFPVGRVVAAEMLAGVVDAARDWFGHANGDCLEDPRLRVVIGDGRNHLLLSPDRYDVIISEPSNPWIAGMGSLFTVENFRLAASRLAPRGVFCQWVQTYQLRPGDLRDMLGTLRAVFPHVHLWGNMTDLFVVAGMEPLAIPADSLAAAFGRAGVRGELAGLGIDGPAELLAYHLGDTRGIDRILERGYTRVTDDNLRLEYRLPQNLFRDFTPDMALEVQRALSPVAPSLVRGGLAGDAWESLLDQVRRVDAVDSRYYGILARTPWGLARSGGDLSAVISEAPAHAPALGRYYQWTRVVGESLHGEGKCDEAGEYLSRVLEGGVATDAYGAALLLGECALREGRAGDAVRIWTRAAAIHPTGTSALWNLGLAHEREGRPLEARALFERALRLDPENPDLRARLGRSGKTGSP